MNPELSGMTNDELLDQCAMAREDLRIDGLPPYLQRAARRDLDRCLIELASRERA